MGDVFFPTLITLGGVCCVRIPWILWVVPIQPTLETVMLSYPVAWIITDALLIPYYYYHKHKLKNNSKKRGII